MRLCQYLRDESILIKVLDVEHFPIHLVAVMSCLVNICEQVFVLEIQSPVFFIVVSFLIIFGWEVGSFDLLHIDSSYFGRRDGARSERNRLLLIKATAAD